MLMSDTGLPGFVPSTSSAGDVASYGDTGAPQSGGGHHERQWPGPVPDLGQAAGGEAPSRSDALPDERAHDRVGRLVLLFPPPQRVQSGPPGDVGPGLVPVAAVDDRLPVVAVGRGAAVALLLRPARR